MRKGMLFRTGCYGAIFCIAIMLGLGITAGPLHADSVETPPGSGNWVVNTDPPAPSPAITAGGGSFIDVLTGATIATGGWGIFTTTDFYTITNDGTIDAGGYGMVIWNNNTVTNNGVIDAVDDGIDAYDDNTITNFGTIDAGSDGIDVNDDNTITNDGTIDAGSDGIVARDDNTITNTGSINAGGYGITARDDNTIFNFGTIDAVDDGIDVNDDNTVTNDGTIDAVDDGIRAYDGNTITNTGTINAGGYGIWSWDNNTITNTGTIDAVDDGIRAYDNSTVTNNGVIDAGSDGIRADDDNTITNTGTIDAVDDGIYAWADNTITNNGTIDAGGDGIGGYYNNTITNNGIINAGGDGIRGYYNNTITNFGTIDAVDDGIWAYDNNTITNFGTIDAGSEGIDANDNNTITNNGIVRGSIGITLVSGTITNMGTIEGTGGIAIQGGSGAMTVNLESGSTLIGNISDSGGIDQVNLNGSGTFSYQFTGIEGLFKNNPGTWRLAHAAPGTFNAVTINAGTLQVDGVLNTTDYTQTPNAVLGIGVQGPATSGVVNVANAPALNNGLLQPIPIGFVPTGATYDVMTTSGFTDYFGGVVSTPVLQYALTYPGNTIARLTVQRNSYVDALGGGTENQRRIAHYLQGLQGSGSDMGDVLSMLDGIPTLWGYRNALDQFSPEAYAGLRDIDLALLNRLGSAVHGRLGSLGGVAQQTPTPLYAALFNTVSDAGSILASAPVFSEEGAEGMDTGIWGRGLGIFGDQDGDDEHFGFDYLTGGLILGADHRFTDRIVAGITAGFADTTVDYDTVISETEAMSYFGGLYGGYTAGQLHLNAHLSWSHNVYHTSRYITAFARRASSEHRANEVYASLEGGYTFTLGGFDLIPTASVQYAYYFADSITEEGAGALNLRVDDFDSHSVVSRIGLRLSRVFDIGSGRFVPQVRAAWAHEYGEIDRTMRARLAGGGGGGTFTVEGYEPGRDSVLLGADISFTTPLWNDRTWGSLFFGYEAELREGLCAHNITNGIRITF